MKALTLKNKTKASKDLYDPHCSTYGKDENNYSLYSISLVMSIWIRKM